MSISASPGFVYLPSQQITITSILYTVLMERTGPIPDVEMESVERALVKLFCLGTLNTLTSEEAPGEPVPK